MVGAMALGVLIGLIVELILDTQTIQELRDKNRRLTLENVQLRREQLRREEKHEVIEIIDNRAKNDEIKFGGF